MHTPIVTAIVNANGFNTLFIIDLFIVCIIVNDVNDLHYTVAYTRALPCLSKASASKGWPLLFKLCCSLT